jgi:hypothetical protein
VGLEGALDGAADLALGGGDPGVLDDVVGQALLALLVQQADAVQKARAVFGRRRFESDPNVDAFEFNAASLARVGLLFVLLARADADLELLIEKSLALIGVVAFAVTQPVAKA